MYALQMEGDGAHSKPSSSLKGIFTASILQIIGGIVIILCGIVLVYIRFFIFDRGNVSNSILGVASGVVVLISGIFGVYGSKRSRINLLMGYLICTTCSVLLLLLVTTTASFAVASHVEYQREHPEDCHGDDDSEDYDASSSVSSATPISPGIRKSINTSLLLYVVLCVMSALEIVVGIVAGVFSCTAECQDSLQYQTVAYQPTSGPLDFHTNQRTTRQ